MKTALISGATSYIGLELVDRLVLAGINVHALLRPSSNLGVFDVLDTQPNCHVIDGTAENLTETVAAIAPDITFHLAGRYVKAHQTADIAPLIADNIRFGAQLLDAVTAAGCRHLINTGSYFQYADGIDPQPYNLYAATKQAFQEILDYYRHAHGLRATTLVLFDTYGARDWRPKLMPAILQAMRTGTELPLPADDPSLYLVDGGDIAAAFQHAAELLMQNPDVLDGQSFAVRDSQAYRISDIVDFFSQIGGTEIRTKPGAYAAPSAPLPALWDGPVLPGWRPQLTLADGIRNLIEATVS